MKNYSQDATRRKRNSRRRRRRKKKTITVDGYTGFLFLNRNGLPKTSGNYENMVRGLIKKYNKTHSESEQLTR